MSKPEAELQSNFIQEIVNEDLRLGLNDGRVHTRFPPEPNGYPHIGHAKAILINYNIAKANGGLFNLRFDDTNPVAEDQEFVDAIMNDIRWLGADWGDRLFYAADYFDHMYDFAVQLIRDGKAYVDDLSIEEIRQYRGTLTQPGKESPYRNRPVEESLDLFARMKAGEFPDGARVLRAKIDMSSGNINMRDPVIYRIRHAHHQRSGDKWCIYPMYDYAHPLEDALEHITHSLCSIEYADHRPLYDWVLDNVRYQIDGVDQRPKQIEFARLNITNTVMSKRKLKKLVEGNYVSGWDDPRMPTIAGLRRRGYTPTAIQDFIGRVGVARSNSIVDVALLEHCIREELNTSAPRVMAVLRPLRLVITNYPQDQVEWVDLENNPEDPAAGTRKVPFSRVIYLEQEDFMENPPKKFFRLTPGGEVRLKGAYIIKCEEVIKDDQGQIVELRCTYDPESKSGGPTSGRKIKGTSHWVSASHAVPATVRLYDYLLNDETPEVEAEIEDELAGEEEKVSGDFLKQLNPNSLETLEHAMLEPVLAEAKPGDRFQFLRQGYFVLDPKEAAEGRLIFNRIVGLRDTWAKVQKTE